MDSNVENIQHIIRNLSIAIIFEQPLGEDFSFFSLVAKVKEIFGSLDKKAEPQPVMPGNIPNLPPEIPRYIFQGISQAFNFSFSALRFDFNFVFDRFNFKTLDDYFSQINTIFENLNINYPFRLGIVFNGSLDINDYEKFKNSMISNDVSDYDEIEISIRKTFENEKVKVNQWKRYNLIENQVNYLFDINTDLATPITNVEEGYKVYLADRIGGLFDGYKR